MLNSKQDLLHLFDTVWVFCFSSISIPEDGFLQAGQLSCQHVSLEC